MSRCGAHEVWREPIHRWQFLGCRCTTTTCSCRITTTSNAWLRGPQIGFKVIGMVCQRDTHPDTEDHMCRDGKGRTFWWGPETDAEVAA